MHEWNLVDADAWELESFPDRQHVQRLVTGLAAPPNRLRRVHVVRSADRVWFLKEFARTQWKNRWRNRLSHPRCTLDAEREFLVALELSRRGIRVARPVAWGRDRERSFYLCAGFAGPSLREALADGRLDGAARRAAAVFVGGLLGGGVRLPDLSADHVFVPRPPEVGFGVIDLHNGGLGRTSARDAARVLRRFVRSLREVPVPRGPALRFAVRALRCAGFAASSRRRILGRVPPIDTHGRYEVGGRADSYARRNPSRTARELGLLARVWPGRRGARVLDSPCGAGRLAFTLREEFGCARVGADRAMAMLRRARGDGDADLLVQADAVRLPFADRAFDGVVVFRLLHHLPRDVAREVAAEAARVAGSFVVVSFFHPVSVHGLMRRLRGAVSGRAATRFALFPGELHRWMRERGFEPCSQGAELPYLRDFWIAAYRRVADGTS